MEGPTHAINAEAASASASQAASAQASQAATAHLQLQPRPHGHYGIGGVMKLVGEKTHLTPYQRVGADGGGGGGGGGGGRVAADRRTDVGG